MNWPGQGVGAEMGTAVHSTQSEFRMNDEFPGRSDSM